MFNTSALLQYFTNNKDLPHVSKYHRENYFQHSMLVVEAMSNITDDTTLLIASCLHDIAKPRTQGLNKIGEPCFYGHDEVSDEELSMFLTLDDPRYSRVKALIWCHMHPYLLANATDYDKAIRKYCRKSLRKAEINIEVDDSFVEDVALLHKADDTGSIRHDEELIQIEDRIQKAYCIINGLK